jgi:uncharacterized membrane protein YphA (DoxX/SURF4 family)
MLLPYWRTWFSEQGYLPAYAAQLWFQDRNPPVAGLDRLFPLGVPRIDLLNGITDPRITYPFYLAVLVLSLLVCLGVGTRFTAFFLALGVVSLHGRDGAILHGGDTVLRVSVIYLAVSPCGRACSVDRLVGLWRNRAPHRIADVSLWSQRLIMFNVALIYFTSVWNKWDGEKWRTLTATYYPERLAEFFRFPYPDFLKSLWMAKITTAGTLLTEFSLGTLVFFPPARKYVLFAGVLMHSWIEYSMNIPLFSFMMISSYVIFFQGEEISAWALRMGLRLRKFHVQIRLPKSQKLTPRGVAIFSAIDPLGLLTFLPGDRHDASALTHDKNEISVQRALATRCVGGWLFLWLPKMASKMLFACLEEDVEIEPAPTLPTDRRNHRTRLKHREPTRGSLNP